MINENLHVSSHKNTVSYEGIHEVYIFNHCFKNQTDPMIRSGLTINQSHSRVGHSNWTSHNFPAACTNRFIIKADTSVGIVRFVSLLGLINFKADRTSPKPENT